MSTQKSTHQYDDFDWDTPVEEWPEEDQIAVVEAAIEVSPRMREALDQSSAVDSPSETEDET